MTDKEEKTVKKDKRQIIECHPELIKILIELRKPISEVTWGIIKNPSFYELTGILAEKIKAGKI